MNKKNILLSIVVNTILGFGFDGFSQPVKSKLSNGLKFNRLETYYDSGYYPKSLYFNVRFAELIGLGIDSVNKCKLEIVIQNKNQQVIPLIKDPKKYVAKSFKEGSQINILFSIPLNPGDASNATYHASLFLLNNNDTLINCNTPLLTSRKTYQQ